MNTSQKFGIVDTHCHLCDESFDNDFDEVVNRAIANDVNSVLILTEKRKDFEKAFELQKCYPDWINICLGIHPVQNVSSHGLQRSVTMKDLKHVKEYITDHHDKIVGIGEIGLDFTPTLCTTEEMQEQQKQVFITQIRLAKQFNLPVNVHSRSAAKATIELLKTEGIQHVQMHAFDGRPSIASIGLAEGYYFSIPTSILRNKLKQELVKLLPLDRILIETDSPILGIAADDRNEPSEALKVCEFIAETKQLDIDVIKQITTENAFKLYGNLKIKTTNK